MLEYDEALDKWVNSGRKFPLIVVLLDGQSAPGLPFLRQLHWIITPDPVSENTVARIFDGAVGRQWGRPHPCSQLRTSCRRVSSIKGSGKSAGGTATGKSDHGPPREALTGQCRLEARSRLVRPTDRGADGIGDRLEILRGLFCRSGAPVCYRRNRKPFSRCPPRRPAANIRR